jgi:hypothetical protein
MAKARSGSKCGASLPSLRTYLQPREGCPDATFSAEGECREDTPAARSVARFAASFGLDTRLGICCFGLCRTTGDVALDLEKLRLAVIACSPEKQARLNQDCKRLLLERCLGSQLLVLTRVDLLNIRSCAERHYASGVAKETLEGLGPPFEATRKAKDIFLSLKAQRQKAADEPSDETRASWAATLLRDQREAALDVPLLLSSLVGVDIERPLPCHVQLGLRPTSQSLRSRDDYAEDSAQVGTAVEEMEFLVGLAPVPRPPPLLLAPMQVDEVGASPS